MKSFAKYLCLILLSCAASFAQFTVVSDTTVTNPDGSAFTGQAIVSWPTFNVAGAPHQAGNLRVPITLGVIHVSLIPNDQMYPANTVYSVVYIQPGKPAFTATWFIPTSSSSLTISQIQTSISGSGGETYTGTSPIAVNGSVISITSPLPVANGGTGTATPGLVAGTNVTVSGAWPNQTIASSSGGSTTRTWLYSAFGVCQGSVAGAYLWMPTSNAPVFNPCTSTTQQGEWTVPAGNTSDSWGLQFVVPAGVTGSWSMVLTWRTADTTTSHTVTLQPSYSCVAIGSAPDNPSYTNLSTVTLTAVSTPSINTNATLTFTPSCAAGSQFRLLLAPSTNTFTSAAQFSYESVAIQASN